MRSLLKVRWAAPAALVGCVGIVGLLAFASGMSRPGRRPPPPWPRCTATCATSDRLIATEAGKCAGHRQVRLAGQSERHLQRRAAQVLRRPRGGAVRRQLLELPRTRGPREPSGRPISRDWGRVRSISGCPPAGCPWPTPACRPPVSRPGSTACRPWRSPPGCSPSPRGGRSGPAGQHQRCRPRVGADPVHPQLRRLPHHHRRR